MDIYQRAKAFYEDARGEKRIIGKTLFGRDIFAVKIGEGTPVGIAQYALHAREYITAELAFAHFQKGVAKGSFWLIPLANPDGALLSQKGLSSVENKEWRTRLTAWNQGEDFSLWKANGRGVDLNVNFPARWGEGAKNTRKEGGENYIGVAPFSENETLALGNFTKEISPAYTVSYHTKGEEIYWYFYQPTHTYPLHKRLAEALSQSTGYPLKSQGNSSGGYKDWCIQALGIPSFTIEAGKDSFSHPLGEEGLLDILQKNQSALYDLSKEYGYEKADERGKIHARGD